MRQPKNINYHPLPSKHLRPITLIGKITKIFVKNSGDSTDGKKSPN